MFDAKEAHLTAIKRQPRKNLKIFVYLRMYPSDKRAMMLIMSIEFEPLTNLDLEQLGCSFPNLHECSLKAVLKEGDKEDIIGYIAIESSPYNLIFTKNDNETIKGYKKKFNCIPSFLLRKVCFTEEYRYTGKLESLFDQVVSKLPFKSIVWCRPSLMGENRDLILQIGGFNPIPYNIDPNVLIFSLQC